MSAGTAAASSRTRLMRIIAILFAFAMLAAACGSDDDGGGGTDDAAATGEGDTDGEDVATTDEPAEEPAEETDADADMGDEMTPVVGGELVSLLEAESDTWEIPGANCAVSCITVIDKSSMSRRRAIVSRQRIGMLMSP